MFGVGPWELVVVLLVVTLLFGKRIPDIARSVGRSILEFKRGTEGIDDDPPPPANTNPPR
jgi:sec-independent protein translocase protein TatA